MKIKCIDIPSRVFFGPDSSDYNVAACLVHVDPPDHTCEICFKPIGEVVFVTVDDPVQVQAFHLGCIQPEARDLLMAAEDHVEPGEKVSERAVQNAGGRV